jgi:chitin disaccharide deacetylase
MVPWPGAAQAIRMLRENPQISFGLHLSVVSEMPGYRIGPVAPAAAVRSLTDGSGCFYGLDARAEFLAPAELGELETEFRAQIQAVLTVGLRPGHLDWHCLADGGRVDIFELTLELAREYRLALRVYDQARAARLRDQGRPANDHGVLDSYCLDPSGKSARYLRLLHDLPAGLTEWALHPALDTAELREIEPDSWQVRPPDYEFLMSSQARQIIEDEGIIMLNHESLRHGSLNHDTPRRRPWRWRRGATGASAHA